MGDGPEIPAIWAFSAHWTSQAVHGPSHTATHSSPRQIPQSLVPPRVAGRCGPAGGACHPRPLSCTKINPPGSRRYRLPIPLPSTAQNRPKSALKAPGGAGPLPCLQSGHAAPHRRSHRENRLLYQGAAHRGRKIRQYSSGPDTRCWRIISPHWSSRNAAT